MRTALRRFLPLLSFTPGLAFAHPSANHAVSFAWGIIHPFGGLDHLLAMIAVGMLAARLKGDALWQLPATFMAMLTIGVLAGIGNPVSPLVEPLIAGSVVAFGILLAMRRSVSPVYAVIVIGAFALAHGYAHGSETLGGSVAGYVAGILTASAALHALGIAAVLLANRLDGDRGIATSRFAGAMLALAGVGIMLA